MFANDQQRRVLRITHLSHRDPTEVHAELEFVNFLKQRGASVCGIIAIKEQLVFSIGEFVCSLFEMASGRLIEYNDWGPDLFRNWGRSVGKFHRLSREFKPTGPRRLDWREDENLNFRARVPRDQEDLLTIGHRYLEKLEQYSTAPEPYGLIHSDAHAGNFRRSARSRRPGCRVSPLFARNLRTSPESASRFEQPFRLWLPGMSAERNEPRATAVEATVESPRSRIVDWISPFTAPAKAVVPDASQSLAVRLMVSEAVFVVFSDVTVKPFEANTSVVRLESCA